VHLVNERWDDWDDWLPMAKLTYNNHVHSSMQHTPFFVDTGQHPCMGFKPVQWPSKVEAVAEFNCKGNSNIPKHSPYVM